MKTRNKIWFLLFVIGLQVLIVTLLFKYYPPRMAGFWAGLGFNCIGLGVIIVGFKDLVWRRLLLYWVNFIYLFFAALPIWTVSLLGATKDVVRIPFGDEQLFFTWGQILHPISSAIFLLLVVSVIWDLIFQKSNASSKK